MKHTACLYAASVALTWSSASPAFIGCQGAVAKTQVQPDGTFQADWGWGWRVICNVSGDAAAPTTVVKKDACASIVAGFLTAKGLGLPVVSYHANSTSCGQALGSGTATQFPTEQPYSYSFFAP